MTDNLDEEFQKLIKDLYMTPQEREEFRECLMEHGALFKILRFTHQDIVLNEIRMSKWWEKVATRLGIPPDMRNRLHADLSTGKIIVSDS